MAGQSPVHGTLVDTLPGGGVLAAPLARGNVVGRYVVLERVGAGGMGVVYAAYDPDLDRRVALKLLHPRRVESADGLSRMLREAQALAKLNHPNVVAVHDVGEHRGGVFVAMEFVQGRTLGHWRVQERPDWRTVLATMIAVGEGLAAAHDKGLVHRDMKPDNVMIDDDDGRVRVMDFGLARPTAVVRLGDDDQDDDAGAETKVRGGPLTRDGAVVGTPGYMAPEQYGGGVVGPAADQFGFCVTLWEALYERRPFDAHAIQAMAIAATPQSLDAPRPSAVPDWVHRVLVRGLSPEAAARWPSMRALLEALRRDQRPRTLRWVVTGALACATLGVFGASRWLQGRERARCIEEALRVDEVYDATVEAQLRDAMHGSGVADPDATLDRTRPWLDRYAASWRAAAGEICEAGGAGTLAPGAMLAAQDCLTERLAEFGELLRLLATPNADVARRAVEAASDLTPVASCRDDRVLARLPVVGDVRREDAIAVRGLLARTAAARSAGDQERAILMSEAALFAARDLDVTPLLARAQLELGATRMRRAEPDAAVPALREAYRLAASSANDDVAADAARRLVYVTGYQLGRVEESRLWYDIAAALHDRLGLVPGDARRIALMSERATVRAVSGELREACGDLQQVLAAQIEQLGEGHPNVVTTLANLAAAQGALGDDAAAERTTTRALDLMLRIHGADHHERALLLQTRAGILDGLGRRDEAIAAAREAVAIQERVFGPEHPTVAVALNSLSMALGGGEDEAVQLSRRALAIIEAARGPEHREVAYCANNLGHFAFERGEFEEAARQHGRAVAILSAPASGGDTVALVRTQFNLAMAQDAMGRFDEAEAVLLAALPEAERALGLDHPFVATMRAGLGRVRVHGGDAAGAIAPLEAALAHYDGHGIRGSALAREQMFLARARWLMGGDRELARGEVRRALGVLEQEGSKRTADVARGWLAESDG